MRLPRLLRLLAAAALMLPASCAAPPSTVLPTAAPTALPTATPQPPTPLPPTPLPPTATPQPPTATPLPPTVTPQPLAPTPTLAPLALEKRQEVFRQVWTLVRDRYVYTDYRGLDWEAVRVEMEPRVDAAADPEAFYALIEELVARLDDEHTRFDSPQEVAEDAARFDGTLRYAGIGALVRSIPEGVLITRLARGGPAELAGIQPRDTIVAVESVPISDTERFGAEGPISAVRGAPGTSVRLTLRSPAGALRDVEVVRQVIPGDAFPDVEGRRLPGTDIALVLIDTFSVADLDGLVKAELQRLTASGPLGGVVLDVRSNGGGRVDLLLDTVGLFVDGGSIGVSEGRRGGRQLQVPADTELPQLAGVPVVVLTGPDTVSAAEMFAGGMQSLGRARVVGQPSAGNTENLIGHDLPDGSRLWLAELVYKLPDGTLIEGRGVQPDRLVEADWWRYAPEQDPQIQAAVALIREGVLASGQ